MTMIGRRSFLTGLVALAAPPAIVRAESLMPVKIMRPLRWDVYVDAGNAGAGLLRPFGQLGDGSLDNPFITIREAWDFVRQLGCPESTVHVAEGIYSGEVLVSPQGEHTISVDQGKRVLITGADITSKNKTAPAFLANGPGAELILTRSMLRAAGPLFRPGTWSID